MAKFAELFPWLRILFPPSEARGFQPSEVSEDVSLIHPVFLGTDFLDRAQSHALSSVNGTAFIQTPFVDDGFFWYVVACSGQHTDPTARVLRISIEGSSSWVLAGLTAAVANNVFLPVGRGFIVPTHQRLRLDANAIAGAQHVEIRVLFFNLRLGTHSVPS